MNKHLETNNIRGALAGNLQSLGGNLAGIIHNQGGMAKNISTIAKIPPIQKFQSN